MASGIFLEFDASHHAAADLLVLRVATNCTGARCRNCSGPFETRSLKEHRLRPLSKLVLDAVQKSEAAKL